MDSPVPKRLKEARLAAKISQKKLGVAAGMDEFSASARMNHYELGRHAPDYSTLKRIADVLKISPAYFYADNDQLAETIKILGQLDYEQQSRIYKKIVQKLSKKPID